MQKTLHQIKSEIDTKRKEIAELESQKKIVVENCPHPDFFVSHEIHDTEDDLLGPGIYEYSTVTYKCSLCEGVFSKTFDKERLSFTPGLKDCLIK